MDAKQFIKIIFDNDTDKYSLIKESIPDTWHIDEMLKQLEKINYKINYQELESYIKYKLGSDTKVGKLTSSESLHSDDIYVEIVILANGQTYAFIRPKLF